MINTTYNLKKKYYNRIESASEYLHISKSDITILLMNKIFKHYKNRYMQFSRIRYQKRDKDNQWQELHASIPDEMYEKSQDMKKVLKMSISFYLSEAVERFLNIVIDEYFSKASDNYCASYVSIIKEIDGIYIHMVMWGLLEEKILTKFLE